MKNEAIFVAYKQEETKYHLIPSEAICTLIKNDRNISEEEKERKLGLPF